MAEADCSVFISADEALFMSDLCGFSRFRAAVAVVVVAVVIAVLVVKGVWCAVSGRKGGIPPTSFASGVRPG